MSFELVKDVALDGVKSELARHDRGDEKKVIFTNLGFANLPNQIYRKSVKDGFEFNLMVCGSSGLGKSTLMNSLFLTDIYSAVSTYLGGTTLDCIIWSFVDTHKSVTIGFEFDHIRV